ncbi:multifunctional CCA addition/repair protein [Reinekea marina]|uniref:Multifunctional CCA protein n=2 Tax=Reinekea marina TaxID=1310421 RepID=A0ABV7WQ67_9GAMM
MKTYLVGGAVRDELLGIPFKDKDYVVVGASPEDLLSQGFTQVGDDFPVFLHPKTKDEYALARTERKSGHGYTGFSVTFDADVTLEEDLLRRDLTINAIAKTDDGQFVDPYGGLADIQNKTLRHVSPAFCEDPLRVLRVARFAARLYNHGFQVADETMLLMENMVSSGELEHLVAERVWQELSRALQAEVPSEFFNVLKRCGALKVIFPELDRLFGIPQTMRWHPEVDTGIHTLKALDICRSMTQQLEPLFATLCHDLGKGLTQDAVLPSHHGHEGSGANLIKKLAKHYKWPTKATVLAERVARYHTHSHNIKNLKPTTIVKLIKSLGGFSQPELIDQFSMVCEADFRGRSGFEQHTYTQKEILKQCFQVASEVTAQRFVDKGLKGKAIGEALDLERASRVKAYLNTV